MRKRFTAIIALAAAALLSSALIVPALALQPATSAAALTAPVVTSAPQIVPAAMTAIPVVSAPVTAPAPKTAATARTAAVKATAKRTLTTRKSTVPKAAKSAVKTTVKAGSSSSGDLATAKSVLASLKATYKYLDGVTVSIGKTPGGYQAVSYYTAGQIVISPTHTASISRILHHEIWHIIDWRDNGHIDWRESVPPKNASSYLK